MLPISVAMGHLMYILLSVLVMECGSLTLTLLRTVHHQVKCQHHTQYMYIDAIIIVICNFIISFIYHFSIISVLCEILQSTENIIVNFTSTAMGSNATYQCRDGSSDVYTTQCTSDGVWEPNPNSVLDCKTPGKMSAPHPAFYMYVHATTVEPHLTDTPQQWTPMLYRTVLKVPTVTS